MIHSRMTANFLQLGSCFLSFFLPPSISYSDCITFFHTSFSFVPQSLVCFDQPASFHCAYIKSCYLWTRISRKQPTWLYLLLTIKYGHIFPCTTVPFPINRYFYFIHSCVTPGSTRYGFYCNAVNFMRD